MPVTPLNYRLSADGLRALIDRLPDPLVVVDDEYRDAVGDGYRVIGSAEFLEPARTAEPAAEFADPDAVGGGAVHLGHHVDSPKPLSSPTTTSPATSPARSSSTPPTPVTPR